MKDLAHRLLLLLEDENVERPSQALSALAAVLANRNLSIESLASRRPQLLQYLPASLVDLRLDVSEMQEIVDQLVTVAIARPGVGEDLWVIGKAPTEIAVPALVGIAEQAWHSFSEEDHWQALCALEVAVEGAPTEVRADTAMRLREWLEVCSSAAEGRIMEVAARIGASIVE